MGRARPRLYLSRVYPCDRQPPSTSDAWQLKPKEAAPRLRIEMRFRNQALDNSKLRGQSAQTLEGRGSGSGRPLELTTADWLEELAVYGTARNLRDQELAYQLSLVIENLYLVHWALRRNS